VLTVPIATPRYAATSLVVHHSACGSGALTALTVAPASTHPNYPH
jgi:hypothetical protein